MYFIQGRPRFWIPGFDTAHLALPALIGLAAVLITVIPKAPAPRPAAPRTEPRLQRPNPAPAILSPVSGTLLGPGQLGVIEGIAPPGSAVQLYWLDRALGVPTRAGLDGRWSFSASRFPPGRHIFRVTARWESQAATSPPVIVTLQAPAAPATPATAPKKHAPRR